MCNDLRKWPSFLRYENHKTAKENFFEKKKLKCWNGRQMRGLVGRFAIAGAHSPLAASSPPYPPNSPPKGGTQRIHTNNSVNPHYLDTALRFHRDYIQAFPPIGSLTALEVKAMFLSYGNHP